MDNKHSTTAKIVAHDAVFCAMLIVFLMVFSFAAYISRSVLGIIIASVLGIYFYKKSLLRCIATVVVTFTLLLMFNGVVMAVGIYLPNLISGLVLCLTFKLNFKFYSVLTTVLFTVISAIEFVLVSVLIAGTSVVDTVMQTFEKYNIASIISENVAVSTTLYVIAFCLIMAIMKMIIAYKIKKILEKRVPSLS